MKVLVVGGGGREHAICWKLAQSPKVTELYCAPGNAGIAQLATCVPIGATDVAGMVAWAKENAMDFVMVAPDDPLALGMVDAMEEAGIRAFGPRKNAAIIEASKSFSKDLMAKYHIPTAKYQTFTEEQAALDYIEAQGAPIVVKADGLALGKGVTVAATVDEAKQAVREMMEDGKFGASGSTVVIEECMTGPEVTVLAFADGEHVVPMLSSQDHKRAFDGNRGPNTGGMGAFAPSPNYTPEIAQRCMAEIFQPTIQAMKAEGRPFHGVLYFGLMLTPEGPKVVEYNARFGDPETQPLLYLLDSDLFDIFNACIDGTLDQIDIRWKDGAACCLVLASGGYPLSYEKGNVISGLDQVEGAYVFHAGTKFGPDGAYLTSGGRVLGVTARGDTLQEAVANAYAAAKPITWKDMQYRTDIGKVWVD
ncbi:MAG: phosphoribosylamine--glycine ligase [Clostridiales bacterium]|nr:phosphoribosylamine--glycine ligase [Clostridiales bacterium]